MISGMVLIQNKAGDEIARFDYNLVKGMLAMPDGRTCVIFTTGDKMVIDCYYSSVIQQTDKQKGHII